MRILVLSDTHVPDFAPGLPAGLSDELDRADLILHAGDVTSAELLEELAAHAPLRVAMGNGDGEDVRAWGAGDEVRLEVEGVRLAMIHDSGPRKGRERRLRRRFPDADVVVFGHSHIPVDAETDGLRLFNPGSPTWKRREPIATYGRIDIARGEVRSRILPLPL
ncbi:MAG TPA: metallophosphoesterase [Actinomycetota bacterium]|nr:metallophosphoesterase [Actinomycetota bacterium]